MADLTSLTPGEKTILSFLEERPDQPFRTMEIADLTGVPKGSVHLALDGYAGSGGLIRKGYPIEKHGAETRRLTWVYVSEKQSAVPMTKVAMEIARLEKEIEDLSQSLERKSLEIKILKRVA